jgi:hypothetical protein
MHWILIITTKIKQGTLHLTCFISFLKNNQRAVQADFAPTEATASHAPSAALSPLCTTPLHCPRCALLKSHPWTTWTCPSPPFPSPWSAWVCEDSSGTFHSRNRTYRENGVHVCVCGCGCDTVCVSVCAWGIECAWVCVCVSVCVYVSQSDQSLGLRGRQRSDRHFSSSTTQGSHT